MNTVSDVLGNSGSPITASLKDGRVVHVSRLDQAGKTRIEQHLKAGARNQVMEDRHEFTDAEFQLAYGAFLDRVASADYKFGGAAYTRFLQSGAGGSYMLRMLSKWDDGKDVTENDLIGIMQVRSDQETLTLAIQQAIAESFPKGQAPAPARGTSGAAA